jgi:hypothetical protein
MCLGLELVCGSHDFAILRRDQISVESHGQEDTEVALMVLQGGLANLSVLSRSTLAVHF